MKLPFCDAHKNRLTHWARLPYINAAIWFVLTLLFVFIFPYLLKQNILPPATEQIVFGLFCVGWPVVCAVWMIAQIWITWAAPIKYQQSGPHHFVLTGVSEQFAAAVKNERDGNWLLWQVEAAGGKEEPPPEAIKPAAPEPPDSRIQPEPE